MSTGVHRIYKHPENRLQELYRGLREPSKNRCHSSRKTCRECEQAAHRQMKHRLLNSKCFAVFATSLLLKSLFSDLIEFLFCGSENVHLATLGFSVKERNSTFLNNRRESGVARRCCKLGFWQAGLSILFLHGSLLPSVTWLGARNLLSRMSCFGPYWGRWPHVHSSVSWNDWWALNESSLVGFEIGSSSFSRLYEIQWCLRIWFWLLREWFRMRNVPPM